jgi:plasmid stabilization system protein ParE
MKVIIRASAEADLDDIANWIAKDSPAAATRMVASIRDHINLLETDELAHMGRPGLVEGTRELVEYPYIIIYRVDEARDEVAVLSIVHGARKRETEG